MYNNNNLWIITNIYYKFIILEMLWYKLFGENSFLYITFIWEINRDGTRFITWLGSFNFRPTFDHCPRCLVTHGKGSGHVGIQDTALHQRPDVCATNAHTADLHEDICNIETCLWKDSRLRISDKMEISIFYCILLVMRSLELFKQDLVNINRYLESKMEGKYFTGHSRYKILYSINFF